MIYIDLKESLSSKIPNGWSKTPKQQNYFLVVDPKSPPSPSVSLKLESLQEALGQWLSNTAFTSLINSLPEELQGLTHTLLSNLKVKELGVSTGQKVGDEVLVSGFNFVLAVDFDNPPLVCGLKLEEVGLQLNFVTIGEHLIWNPILEAKCEFMGVKCALSISLFSPSITLVLSQINANIDSILSHASHGTTFSALKDKMAVSYSGEAPKVKTLMVTAQLAAQPTFSCSLVLDLSKTSLKWKGKIALTGMTVTFSYGAGDVAFSFSANALVGGYEVNALISHHKATESTQFQAALSTKGSSIHDFWNTFSDELGITNPLPAAWPADMELSGVSLCIQHTPQETTFAIRCGGSLVFDGLGASLRFDFNFSKKSQREVVVSLQLGDLNFELDKKNGQLVFSSTGPKELPLLQLVQLAQVYPLYDLAQDIHLTVEKALLVIAPPTSGSGHHLLCVIQTSFHATSNKSILDMITGGSVEIHGATIYAANSSWSLPKLREIATDFPLNSPISKGISLTVAIEAGGVQSLTPLVAHNTNSGVEGTATSPRAVSSPNAAKWFDVQKKVGPLYLERVGIGLGQSNDGMKVSFLCDGAFNIGPLTVSLQGFSIGVPVKKIIDFSVSLDGLAVSYNKPPLLISGGFLSTADDTYIGDLLVTTKTLSLAAIGEYARKGDYTSLALFAAITEPPIGGPTYAFVTGLAAGGGYNSALKIPSKASEVVNFALVQAAAGKMPLTDPFQIIENCIQPEKGEDWFAAGLLVRSFELVQSTILLTAAFGNKLQFAVLGQSEMSIPPESTERLAYAQVDVEATYVLESECIEVTGVLTPNSFVLSPDCHIQGGFVFMLNTSGDFITSFGGYAPHFNYKALGYPSVKPLSVSWQIDAHCMMKGTQYFAITPAVMMVGGSRQATWNSGIFSAWFDVQADLFMQWKPFHYQANFTMSLGVSFDLKVAFVHVHFTFHIGANLFIEGPPFRGHTHIDLDVVSFDIDFGPAVSKPNLLTWEEFRKMLPGADHVNKDNSDSELLTIKTIDGLVKDLTQQDQSDIDWVVNGTHFCFDIHTNLPITKTASGDVSVKLPPTIMDVGILPMGVNSISGELEIIIRDPHGEIQSTTSTNPGSLLVVEQLNTGLAPAYWSKDSTQTINTRFINGTSGYKIYGRTTQPPHTSLIDQSVLLSDSEIIDAVSNRKVFNNPFKF